MAVIGGGCKYLTWFKDTAKDEEDGTTISVHATDGEKTTGFGQDSEALAGEENQRAERRLEASVNRKRGGSDNDPAKHPVDVLVSFVQTFLDSIKLLAQKWAQCMENLKLLGETQPGPKCPEQELVELTQAHIQFPCSYTFPSYQKGWIISKRERKIDVPERLIARDCEMVDCEGGEAQIVKIFAVDRNCDILIDELVLPNKKVVDYLTHITGVKAEDLEGVSLTQEAVQAVLRYDFRVEGKPHNCLDDAIVPMRLVLHRLEHGLEESDITQSERVKQESVSKLFLHKLPNFLTVTDLQTLFTIEFPCEIQVEITVKSQHKTGSTYAVFKSREEADSAFEQLEGFHAMELHYAKLGLAKAHVELQLRNIDVNRLQQLEYWGQCSIIEMYEHCSSTRAFPC
ncbi:unnamed protein product [Sphagnum compactum]